MSALARIMSSRLLPCAAAMAAALAAPGCIAPEDDEPELVAEAESPLQKIQVAPGLVHLYQRNGELTTLLGYGYITDLGEGKSIQRWLMFTNVPGNDLVMRPYNHQVDPAGVGLLQPSDESWKGLVDTHWANAALGAQKYYAVCVSQTYVQAGTYNGVSWRTLPSSAPPAAFPAYSPLTKRWSPHVVNVTSVPQPSPLVWPPSGAWLNNNAVPDITPQLDPGDGKLFQYQVQNQNEIELGSFYSQLGVNDETNTEHFFMFPSYAAAGDPEAPLNTRLLGNTPQPLWLNAQAHWSHIAPLWTTGAAVSVNGCVNYSKPDAPAPF